MIAVETLLEEFNKTYEKESYVASRIQFEEIKGHDIYNITAPFISCGKRVIAGRVERRDSEHSKVYFFEEKEGVWNIIKDAPIFQLQDPFVSMVCGELIFGGVHVFPHPDNPKNLWWCTQFYRGKDIYSLELFFEGPSGMKDIRLVELKSGEVGIFTRPQGEKGGRGKIGYTQVATLNDLTKECIEEAPVLDHVISENWIGGNEIHLLENGELGVLSHVASFDEKGDRHYYSSTFIFHPESRTYRDFKIIAKRALFLEGPTKRGDLVDVVFSGGLERVENSRAILYAGISDAEAQSLKLPDPFKN